MTRAPPLLVLLVVVSLSFAAACAAEVPPPRGSTTITAAVVTAEPPPPPAPAPTSPTPSALAAATPSTVAAPAYVITGTGRRSEEWGAMFAPTQDHVDACVAGSRGVVTIRIDKTEKKTLFTIDPNVSLDVEKRRCILEALSTIKLDEDQDPSKRAYPTGFTSHVVIAW